MFIGGTDIEKDRRTSNQPQLVIGTPTRINDLAQSGHLHAHLASYLIVDEVDLMIDLGLIEDVDLIASRLDENSHIVVVLQFLNHYNHFK